MESRMVAAEGSRRGRTLTCRPVSTRPKTLGPFQHFPTLPLSRVQAPVNAFIPRHNPCAGGVNFGLGTRVMLLFVSNLAFLTTDQELRSLFEPFGPVVSACIAVDQDGRPRGLGFVAFVHDHHARAAIAALDGQTVDGRTLRVSVADARQIQESRLAGGIIGGLPAALDIPPTQQPATPVSPAISAKKRAGPAADST